MPAGEKLRSPLQKWSTCRKLRDIQSISRVSFLHRFPFVLLRDWIANSDRNFSPQIFSTSRFLREIKEIRKQKNQFKKRSNRERTKFGFSRSRASMIVDRILTLINLTDAVRSDNITPVFVNHVSLCWFFPWIAALFR